MQVVTQAIFVVGFLLLVDAGVIDLSREKRNVRQPYYPQQGLQTRPIGFPGGYNQRPGPGLVGGSPYQQPGQFGVQKPALSGSQSSSNAQSQSGAGNGLGGGRPYQPGLVGGGFGGVQKQPAFSGSQSSSNSQSLSQGGRGGASGSLSSSSSQTFSSGGRGGGSGSSSQSSSSSQTQGGRFGGSGSQSASSSNSFSRGK